MSKHTPEPWVQWEGTDSIYAGEIIKNTPSVLTGNYVRVADCDMFDNTWEVNAANTKRIVACVNAFAGVSDPEMFMRLMKGVKVKENKVTDNGVLITFDVEQAIQQLNDLKAQRDELLDALRDAERYLCDGEGEPTRAILGKYAKS